MLRNITVNVVGVMGGDRLSPAHGFPRPGQRGQAIRNKS